jgi:acyl transferase domain-containing protein
MHALLQALSPVGRCKTFDSSADGYGRGEGFAAVMLTQEATATADTAGLLAVVRGSAVNTAGRSSGLTAPSGPAQQKLVAAALAAAQLSAGALSYLAVHGTGTPLGDPIGECSRHWPTGSCCVSPCLNLTCYIS